MPTNKIIYGPGRIPQASEFAIGEIIINVDDAKVYSKDKQNIVFELVGGGEGDGFKNVYLSTLQESGSLSGNPLVVTQGTTGLTGSEGLDIDTDFLDDLRVGDIIKIVSGAFSSFHEITSIDSDVRADFTPAYQNNSINVGAFDDTNITIMARNPSGSILITSSVENRNLIFSGSSGVSVITGSEPNSIEISIDGTAVSAQSDNIQGTLFSLNDSTGQERINFTPDGGINSGTTISAKASGLTTTSDPTFRHTTVTNLTATGDTVKLSGLDDITTEEHVVVINPNSDGRLDYIETSSLIPRIQSAITSKINPYDPNDLDLDFDLQQRVGGVQHNDTFAAGTPIEDILREILIDFNQSEISSVSGRLASDQEIPFDSGFYREPGDEQRIDNLLLAVTLDSDGEGFGGTDNYSATMTGNSNGNTLPDITIFGTSTSVQLSFAGSVFVDRTTAGSVTLTATGTDSAQAYSKSKSVSGEFEHAIFIGSLQNLPEVGETLGPVANWNNYQLANLTGSGVVGTGDSGTAPDRPSSEYDNTILISHKDSTNGNIFTDESPSATDFPQESFNQRGITLKTGPKSNDPGHYTVIAYPTSYGTLTSIDTSGGFFGANVIDEFFDPEIRQVTRYGVTTDYYVYRTIAHQAFQANTKLTLRNT